MNDRTEKLIYTVAAVMALVLSISSVALVAVQGRNDARQARGAVRANHAAVAAIQQNTRVALQTTAAVCALRSYYEGQVRESEAFLRLTPAERLAKYGPIAAIPTAEIRAGLARERRIVTAFQPLRCPRRVTG